MRTPHHLRFARSLALLSALGVTPACSTDVGTGLDGGPLDAWPDCSSCTCWLGGSDMGPSPYDTPLPDAGLPLCPSLGARSCCPAVGPLAPPELPA